MDSEGLLLLSNDGDLIHALTHPRFHVKKVYHVLVDRTLREGDAQAMVRSGVVSDGDVLRAGSVSQLERGPRGADGVWYEVELFEGKNRQVRRMFEAVSRRVTRLIRIQFGSVKLGGLALGAVRDLTEREVRGLRNAGHR
jgi:23S rRNA pseudouridine2605 synthase